MPTGDRETRIRRLEQIAEELSSLLSIGTRRLVAAEQDAYDLWAAGKPYTQPPPNCTFSGQAAACAGQGLPNAVITISQTSTGALLWSGTADGSGNFSGAINIGSSSVGVGVNVAPSPTDPFAARFVSFTSSYTFSPGSNNLGRPGLNLATGYHCSPYAYYPLNNTLFLTDSFYGAATLTFGSYVLGFNTLGGWGTSKTVSYPGCPGTGCAANSSVDIRYILLNNQATLNMGYGGSPCPNTNSTTAFHTASDQTSIAVTTASPITLGATATLGSALFCGRSITFTITE